MGKIYGYIRVSHSDMNLDRQTDAMEQTGINFTTIFADKQSGKDFNRNEYIILKRIIGKEDCIYIKSIDRLGRNYKEILEEWGYITIKKKADIVVLDMPLLDTRQHKDLLGTFISDLVLQVLSFVAESERTSINSRQKEGIASSKKRGVKFGRPKRVVSDKQKNIISLYMQKWESQEITTKFFMEKLELKPNSFYRLIELYKKLYY